MIDYHGLCIKLCFFVINLIPDFLCGIAGQHKLCAQCNRTLRLREGNVICSIGKGLEAHIAEGNKHLGIIRLFPDRLFSLFCLQAGAPDHAQSLFVILVIPGIVEHLLVCVRPGFPVRTDKGFAVIRICFKCTLQNGGHFAG